MRLSPDRHPAVATVLVGVSALVGAVAFLVLALQPAVGRARGFFRENLPSTLTAVSIGSPPSVYSVNFFGIAPLEIPDPDADPALSNWGYRYRVTAAGNLPDASLTSLIAKLALWDSNSQVWRPLERTTPTSGLNAKFLQLWVNTKCPRMYLISLGAGTLYDSIDSSGKCSDADPTASSPKVNLPQTMGGLPIGASLNAIGGAAFGSEVGNPTVFGGVINSGAGLYKLDNLPSQPLWSSKCSPAFGAITRIAVGNYDPVNDTYTVIGLDGSNKIVRGQSAAGSSVVTCTVVTVATDSTVVLNDVAFVGSTATVIAVGNGGKRYVSMRSGAINAGSSGGWAAVTESGGQAYTNLGYPGAPPDLVGVAAFASGTVGRSAVLLGNRSSSSPSNVTPVYRVEDVAKPGALDSPSTDLFANLAAIGGIDPEHFWAVRNGMILRSFPGRVSGYNWFGPDAASDPNGFFAKLSCGTTATCDLLGQNYGLNIESSSGLQPSALTGRAWVGLADGTAGALSGGIQPALQEHTELTPGVLGQRIGVQNATTANRLDRTAVAGNYLYAGGRLNNDATIQRIERRQITSSGDSAGQLVPFSGTTTCASGTKDVGDNGYFQFGTPTVNAVDYLQVVSPCNGTAACPVDQLRVRTIRADDANFCSDLKSPPPASVALVQNPGCNRSANAADYGVADYLTTLYTVGGSCGGVASNQIFRSTVAADGTPGNAVANATQLWTTMRYPQVFVAQPAAGAAMVVYDPTSHQLGVAPINTVTDERCSGPVGTVCTFTVQTNAVPVGLYNGVSSFPRAVGGVGSYLVASYWATDFADPQGGAADPRAAFRGRTVLVSRIRLEASANRVVSPWFAAADRTPSNFPPLSMTAWSSGSRAAVYFGPILDDRGWWSVQRYDLDGLAAAPGWLSFDYADNLDYQTGLPQLPPAPCIRFGTASHPGLSRVIQTKGSYTLTDPVSGCVVTLYPDEAWGWGRFLNLKAEGERQSPRQTDWGWVSLRGPTVSVPSSAVLQSSFQCFDCAGTAPSGTCAFCESNTPKLSSNSQPTCSQCTGCDPITGICGAGGGSCATCYRYGVNLDPTSGGTFHGYGWSGGQSTAGADVGFGWVSFEQGATGLTRFATFVQAQYGSIYSGGKISSTRGASPFTEFGLCNAFLVQSASDTITSLCADVTNKQLSGSNPQTNSNLGAFNPGLVTNATPIPFPKTENQFISSVGPLDITGLTTVTKTVGGVKYNQYGNVVVELTSQQFLDQFDGAGDVLGGKIYNLQENLTVTTPLVFKAGTTTVSGAGLIVVNGTLRFAANVTYENVAVDKISQLASAGWIVNTGSGGPPDLSVESQVTDIAGTFFVRGSFRALTNGRTDAQLIVHGPALAHEFDLQRNAAGNPQSLFSGQYIGGAVGSEVFVDDGRLRLNPPPGFQNLRAALPIFK